MPPKKCAKCGKTFDATWHPFKQSRGWWDTRLTRHGGGWLDNLCSKCRRKPVSRKKATETRQRRDGRTSSSGRPRPIVPHQTRASPEEEVYELWCSLTHNTPPRFKEEILER